MMITELNPIYEAAWQEQEGSGSFYYMDPDKVEPAGKPLKFPCLFRLLRTTDTITSTNVNDRYTRDESFLACIKVDDFPDLNEEKLENKILAMVQGFLHTLREDRRVQFDIPTSYSWFRRDIQEFCICLNFTMKVSVIAEDWLCK